MTVRSTFTTILGGSLLAAFGVLGTLAQAPPPPPSARPGLIATQPKLSKILAERLAKAEQSGPVGKDDAVKGLRKLLEGERYQWRVKNARSSRSQAEMLANVTAARNAFREAAEADPNLAEAYTALAELAISAPPSDVEESIELARLALRVDPKNFGARRILARLYTYKSGLGTRSLDSANAERAVSEWQFIASLDPRNAEAWAFLAEFYDRQDKQSERIAALQKWRSAATPIESQFFQQMTGGRSSLAPESASVPLGEALVKSGRHREAIEALSNVIAEDPENLEAVNLLRQAILANGSGDASAAIAPLQQAVYANPGNSVLVDMLAESYSRAGRVDDAVSLLSANAKKAGESDPERASLFYLSLAKLLARSNRFDEAKPAFASAISARSPRSGAALEEADRIFLRDAFDQYIHAAKAAGREADVVAAIDQARTVLGPDDLFADRQLAAFYKESGKREDALKAIRAMLVKSPLEEGLARQEAMLLTELGRVDEAVDGYRKFVAGPTAGGLQGGTRQADGKNTVAIQRAANDPFSSEIYISQLYSQAGRTKESIDAANKALAVARSAERRQIALLSIASARQMAGDFAGAEATLRDILKESPNNPIAQNNLGYFLLERGERFDEALTLIKRAVETEPNNPSYLDSLGWAYFKLNKLGEAEMYLKEALRHDPASSTINEHLGDVYDKQGKMDHAKNQWQRSLKLASDAADIARLTQKLK